MNITEKKLFSLLERIANALEEQNKLQEKFFILEKKKYKDSKSINEAKE